MTASTALKARFPDVFIGINGGIVTVEEAQGHLRHVDGVMMGRAAYKTPGVLAAVDRVIFGAATADPDPVDAIHSLIPYIDQQIACGTHLSHITRHLLGLFHGRPGARAWRRILTVEAVRPGAGSDVVRKALAAIQPERAEPDLAHGDEFQLRMPV